MKLRSQRELLRPRREYGWPRLPDYEVTVTAGGEQRIRTSD
jgi:hypothetical protein